MKKALLLTIFAIAATTVLAQEDKSITEVLEEKYDFVVYHESESNGKFYGVKRNGKYGVCDLHGNEIISCKYDGVVKHTGYFGVKLNQKEGACDLNGKEIIPCQYSYIIYNQGMRMFDVCLGGIPDEDKYGLIYDGKWGVFDENGKNIIPCKYTNQAISYFFYTGDYARVCINGTTSNDGKVRGGKWGVVDNTGHLLIQCQYDGIGTVNEGVVPINIGGNFESDQYYWNYVCNGGKWGYIDLAGIILIEPKYDSADSFEAGVAHVSLNGQSTLIENPIAKGKANITGLASDVDINIPVTTIKNEETFVFIFANEHYATFNVTFANNDGKIFKEYCAKTLGIAEKNIRFYEDATFGNMVSAINKIKEIADVYDGDARFIVYYSGQGLTDENSKMPYLLPVDAVLTTLSTTGYSIEKLNNELSQISAKSTLLIIDACFNGSDREGKMLTTSRGVTVKIKANHIDGSLILWSATSGDETAYQYKDKNHGLFTYFLLKKLQESKGDIDYKSLSDYVNTEVKKQSISNVKIQSPSVTVSDKLTNWQSLKFK